MKYLVTGGQGFIGSNVTKMLLEAGDKVHVVDDLSTGHEEPIFPICKEALFTKLTLGADGSSPLVYEIVRQFEPDYILHLAALPRVLYSVEHPQETAEANITGLLDILEAARKVEGVKRVIFSSSSSIYGNSAALPTSVEQGGAQPQLSPYALQKWIGELWCRMYSELYDLDTACLRYFNVFGPGQLGNSAYSTAISAFIACFCLGTQPHIDGDGEQSRDLSFVDDVVHANIKAAAYEGKLEGRAFNVANGEALTINYVFEKTMQECFEQTGRAVPVDVLSAVEKRPTRLGDVRHTLADIAETTATLGWQPLTSFEQGLRETIEWNIKQWQES